MFCFPCTVIYSQTQATKSTLIVNLHPLILQKLKQTSVCIDGKQLNTNDSSRVRAYLILKYLKCFF